MSNPFQCTSAVFCAGAACAFTLLLVHALRTHGGAFAVIWLGLTTVLGGGIAEALHGARLTLDLLLFCSTSFYLAALFAKGFVERTRHAGSPWAFGFVAALCWLPFGWSWEARPAGVYSTALQPAGGIRFGHGVPDGFMTGFAGALFLFALSYRLVSLRTSNNVAKLGVLAVLLPLFVVLASAVGSRL